MKSSRIARRAEMGSWSNIPDEITARVMSILPTSAFCTCRTVCKTWNELLRRPEVVELHERANEYPYLFLISECYYDNTAEGAHTITTCSMDLENRQWLSLGNNRTLSVDKKAPHILEMGGGLICEFSNVGDELRFVLIDPVAKTTKALPALLRSRVGPHAVRRPRESPPVIVPVVENGEYKVFVLRRLKKLMPRMFVLYESSTNAWRDLGDTLEELELSVPERERVTCAKSAVYFRGKFYATFHVCGGVTIRSFDLEKSCWTRVLSVASQNPGLPELVVFNNRMFLSMWLDGEPRRSFLSRTAVFQIREIFDSKSVVRIPYLELQRAIYGPMNVEELQFDISFGFPLNSDSVLLVLRNAAKLIEYNVMSGHFRELPAHPLSQASLDLAEKSRFGTRFHARLMKPSLRNLLSSSVPRLPAWVEEEA